MQILPKQINNSIKNQQKETYFKTKVTDQPNIVYQPTKHSTKQPTVNIQQTNQIFKIPTTYSTNQPTKHSTNKRNIQQTKKHSTSQ